MLNSSTHSNEKHETLFGLLLLHFTFYVYHNKHQKNYIGVPAFLHSYLASKMPSETMDADLLVSGLQRPLLHVGVGYCRYAVAFASIASMQLHACHGWLV